MPMQVGLQLLVIMSEALILKFVLQIFSFSASGGAFHHDEKNGKT
jgi:hypothetical protein